jgi:hypothetical protein
MKAKIAVATVSGKAYFLIVKELKRKNMPFVSLTPYEPVPVEVEVVLTTEDEENLIEHGKKLVYKKETDPESLVNEALQIIQGKENFHKIAIGVDPGDVFGLAVLADGKVIETQNCLSVEEAQDKIKKIVKNLENTHVTSVSVKIGDGVPAFEERLLRVLDKALPSNIVLEAVSEAGTNRCLNESKHRRGLRDIVSAIQIAGRTGRKFQRRKTDEADSSKRENSVS